MTGASAVCDGKITFELSVEKPVGGRLNMDEEGPDGGITENLCPPEVATGLVDTLFAADVSVVPG